MRASGILLPIFSLPSKYGAGDVDAEAYNFIDRLHEAGQRYWQVLPIGPVNREFCPYQSGSGFAGEPLLISLERLRDKGLLTDQDLAPFDSAGMTWEERMERRRELLKKAFGVFREKLSEDEEAELHFLAFCRMEGDWLDEAAARLGERRGENR